MEIKSKANDFSGNLMIIAAFLAIGLITAFLAMGFVPEGGAIAGFLFGIAADAVEIMEQD